MSEKPGDVIHIDKQQYRVEDTMTGAQLRLLPTPPIGSEFDLWQEMPGGQDILIKDDVSYQMKNGLHFFTAPANINPGTRN